MSDLKQRVVFGLVWRGLERIGTQGLGFIISIILARRLGPTDYGTIALTTVFIAIAGSFISGGFSFALIQKKDATEKDYNSVFYLSLAVSGVMCGVLFIGAPWAAAFYKTPVLVWVLRILAVSLIVGASNVIQGVVLNREMKFKTSFKVSLIATVAAGIVSISMAYSGYGIWALVGSSLTAQVASTIVLWKIVSWRPRFMFSFAAIRHLFGFGSKLLVADILENIFSNIYSVIIGRLFDPTTLGYYSRGQSIPNVAMATIQGTIGSVMFPALASCQHDKARVKEIVRRSIKSSCFLVFPMMFGLAAIAKPLVFVLLGDKWLPCVPYLQLSCIIFALYPVHVANIQAINALGRSDINLCLAIIKKTLNLLVILTTFKYGAIVMVLGQAIFSIAIAPINAWPNRRLFNYSFLQQVMDIMPAFSLAAGMGVLVWWMTRGIGNSSFLLVLQIILGMVIYLVAAILFKLESAEYLWYTVQQSYKGVKTTKERL